MQRLAASTSASRAAMPSSALLRASAERMAATAALPCSTSARSALPRAAMTAAFCSTPSLFQGEIVAPVKAAIMRASRSLSAALMRSATLCQRVKVKVCFIRGAHYTVGRNSCASVLALLVAFAQHFCSAVRTTTEVVVRPLSDVVHLHCGAAPARRPCDDADLDVPAESGEEV